MNKIEVKQFKDQGPGLKGMKNFMKHYKFSDEKAEMISTIGKEYLEKKRKSFFIDFDFLFLLS